MKATAYLALLACVVPMSGCFSINLFQPFDHATNDPQLISAARACLDKGDYSCALTDYQKLSGNNADIANSEEAYTLYNNAGVDMGAFIGAFGSGNSNAGSGVTAIANSIPANVTDPGTGNSISTLLEIFHGYQKVSTIQNQQLRGIVRIVGAVGIISAILSDLASSRGDLKTSDIALNPTLCENAGLQCANAGASQSTAPCHQPNSNVSSGTAIAWASATSTNDPLAQATDSTIVPSFGILFTAIEAAELGLTDLGVTSGSALNLFSTLGAAGAAAFITDVGTNPSSSSPCFRQLLLDQQIGN